MGRHVAREDAQRAAEQHQRAVRVVTGPAARDLADPALQALGVARLGLTGSQLRCGVGEGGEPMLTGAALPGALPRQEADQRGGLGDAAAPMGKDGDDTAAQRDVDCETQVPRVVGSNPAPEISTNQHGGDAAIIAIGKSLAPLTQGGRIWPGAGAYDGAIVVSGYSFEGISGNELPLADVFKYLPAAVLKAKVAGRRRRKNLAAK